MTRLLLVLFAVAGGAAVGNLYYAQPLLDIIAASLHTGQGAAGLLVTATQVGYAAGIMFIVPLGDLRNRRNLVPLMMLVSALALGVCAVAPNIVVLTAALAAVGITTVAGQLLVPFADDLAEPAERGRVVGIVVSGLVTGLLAGRILGGLIAGAAGWRTVFVVAAGIMVILAALLYRLAPVVPAKTAIGYRRLLVSVVDIIRAEPLLRVVMAYGAIGFGSFTMFWTALTFLLSGAPYHYSATVIGLFGVVGLMGSLAAQGAGRLHDRGWSVTVTGLFWLLGLAAWALSELGRDSLAFLLAGVIVLDIATQGRNILNQATVLTLSVQARSRVNTAYVAANFTGGAIGSIVASVLWAAGGWTAVVTAGGLATVAGLVLWLAAGRRLAAERTVRCSAPGGGRSTGADKPACLTGQARWPCTRNAGRSHRERGPRPPRGYSPMSSSCLYRSERSPAVGSTALRDDGGPWLPGGWPGPFLFEAGLAAPAGRRSRKIHPAATPPTSPPMCACQSIPVCGSSTENW
jgi:predicted MFS family arabinose efflux permease